MKRYKFLSVMATMTLIVVIAVLAAGRTLANAPPTPIPLQEPSISLAEPQALIVLTPTALTWVSDAEPDISFGGRGYAWVGRGQGTGTITGRLRGLAQFDLSRIPAGARPTSARLYATITAAQEEFPDHFNYFIGWAMAPWTEATTWNTWPGCFAGYGEMTDISATSGVVSWDVLFTVERWLDGTNPQNGFCVARVNDTEDPQIHARRFSNLQLLIAYEILTPTPTPQPLVQITKTNWSDPVYAGDEVQYTISLRNLTGSTIPNLVLQDTIPVGTTYVEGSSGASFDGNRTVTWQIPTLGVGYFQSVNLTLRTSPRIPDGTVLTNRASISYPCPTGTCIATVTQTTIVRRAPTPTATATPPCPPDEAGTNFNTAVSLPLGPGGITAYICPAGDEDWFKFPVNAGDTIDGLLYDLPADYAVYLVRPDGVHQATYDQEGLADEHILWWGITAAQAGEWRVEIFGPGGAFSTQPYRLMMQVRAATPTPTRTPTRTPTPTRTVTPTPTTPRPSLAIGKQVTSGTPYIGQDVTYSITVTNTGQVRVNNLQVWDMIPPNSSFISASPMATYASGTVTWLARSYLDPGASATYRLTVRVSADTPDGDVLFNRAFAQADGVARIEAQRQDTAYLLPDLTVADAQVIQVISPGTISGVDSPIPLVEGKHTAVRVVVDTGLDRSVPSVTGRLYYQRPEGDSSFVKPDGIFIEAPPDPSLENDDDTLNFFLPTSYLNGEVRWWVELNPEHQVLESDYTNNRWPQDPNQKKIINFQAQRSSYRISYLNIGWAATEGDSLTWPTFSHTEDADWYLQRIYPLSPSNVDYYIEGAMYWYGDDWFALIAELNNIWDYLEIHDPEGAPDQLVGWLPTGTSGYGGLSDPTWAGGRGLVVFANDDDPKYPRTMAHEIGHNLGRYHPCDVAGGDPDWPYADTGSIQVTGFDPLASHEEGVGVWSAGTDDFMTGGHCGHSPYDPKWISPYTYKGLIAPLGPSAAALRTSSPSSLQAQADQTVLLVTGAVRDDRLDLFASYQVRLPQAVTLLRPDPGQDYCIALRDAGGTQLDSFCFNMPERETEESGPDYSRSFSVPFLYHPNTAELVAWEQAGPRLARRRVSANAPQITGMFPNGGETISEPFNATWTASDLDGDTLTYAVLYSRDDGAHWRPLITGLDMPSFTLDPERLPGSGQARLRIVATDGIRTIHRDSAGSFSVPTKPPRARILFPRDGFETTEGEPVTFFGRGFDWEDGVLSSDASFAWYSSLSGPLGSGRRLALETLSAGQHTVTLMVTDSEGKTGSDSIVVTVAPASPPPCTANDLAHNGGFETGDLRSWHPGGAPQPVVVDGEKHSGEHALLLGNPAQQPAQPTLSFIRQYVRIPADATQAALTFWYKVRTADPHGDYDWFGAYLLDPTGEQTHQIVKVNANTGWLWASYDLTEFRGQTIGIGFFVRNDGQSGATWAFVDDVVICADGTLPPPPEPDACWLLDGLTDYAPAGLPDFDQQQGGWTVPGTQQWSHDGPAAVADLLWWRDSAEEPGSTAPPTVSDSYGLVRTYGTWDDHDPQNVPSLIADLATRMFTNSDHPGTDLDDLVAGLNTYLGSMGLAGDYTLTLRKSPSFDWVREEVKQNRQVLLLLGFWELQPGGWRRLGGHYVAVAGASCEGDGIAFSDPFRDYAEAGWPGRMAPTTPHGHPAEPPDAVHNDASYVSHDVYGIMRTAAGWGPQGYARSYQDVDSFAGLNFAPALEPSRAGAYLGGEIVTLADFALVLAPQSEVVTLKLSPTTSHVSAGQSFLVEMEVLAGMQSVDAVSAYLDFDPAVLQVVDENGDPATQITPGTTLSTVTANSADNATGRINFAAGGGPVSGRFNVATIRFRAITTTLSSPLTWSTTAPRQSDVRLGGSSVLGSLQDGTVVVGPGAFLAGQATMQGRPTPPDASWSVPLLLTLSQPGERGAAYVYGTVSNQNGIFAMPGVAVPGNYRVRLKGLHTLRNLLPTALSGGANPVDMETLLEGDAFNNNRVDMRDVSVVAAAYGKSQGQSGFDPRADFNEDDMINDADVNLLRANLGQRGDVLVGSPVSGLTSHEEPETWDLEHATLLAGTVSLRLVPGSNTATVGDVVVLDVVTDAGAQPVDAAELHLDYDPTVLQAVDAAGAPTTQTEPGAALPTVFLNNVDPARGWADYLASSLGGTPASGQFTVTRLRFKVLKAEETWVRFSFSDWRPTDAIYRGQSVLGSVVAAQVRVAGNVLYLPVIMKR